MSRFVCAISGTEPEVAVASPVSGEVFEKRLLIKYIEENGTDPITGHKLDTSNLVELKQDPGIRSMQKSITSGGGSFLTFAKLVAEWKWIVILLIVLQIVLGVLATDSTASSNLDLKMLIPFFSILTGLVVICGFIWAIVHVLVNSKFDVVLAKMEAMKSDQRAELRGEMNGIRENMNGLRGEFNGLRGEFNGLRGEFNGKLEIVTIQLRGDMKGLSGEMNAMKSELNGRINVLQAEMNGKR